MPSPNDWTEELKIQVTKAIFFDGYQHYRFYHPSFRIGVHNKNIRPNVHSIFALNCESDRYPEIRLRSEKELCWFIYQRWGAGIYLVWYWKQGLKGRFVLWRGAIDEDGFCFEKYFRPLANEIRRLKKELKDPYLTPQERRSIINEISEIQQDPGSHIPRRRPSYIPFLFPSSRRGEFMTWAGDDINLVYDNLDEESKTELMYEDLDRKDKEETERYFSEMESDLRKTNPEVFEW
jgi:hypothetical protein